MEAEEFKPFRLVGGTALSLQLGHRLSVDIDLFTDADYGSIDFNFIETYLKSVFNVDSLSEAPPAFGKSYFIGNKNGDTVKLDVFYTDAFISPLLEVDKIRLAGIAEITAMKMDVIQRGGRKKDFWDIHELMNHFSISEMIEMHQQRYPFSHDKSSLIKMLSDYKIADDDFDPICLKGKYWEFIKEDIEDALKTI